MQPNQSGPPSNLGPAGGGGQNTGGENGARNNTGGPNNRRNFDMPYYPPQPGPYYMPIMPHGQPPFAPGPQAHYGGHYQNFVPYGYPQVPQWQYQQQNQRGMYNNGYQPHMQQLYVPQPHHIQNPQHQHQHHPAQQHNRLYNNQIPHTPTNQPLQDTFPNSRPQNFNQQFDPAGAPPRRNQNPQNFQPRPPPPPFRFPLPWLSQGTTLPLPPRAGRLRMRPLTERCSLPARPTSTPDSNLHTNQPVAENVPLSEQPDFTTQSTPLTIQPPTEAPLELPATLTPATSHFNSEADIADPPTPVSSVPTPQPAKEQVTKSRQSQSTILPAVPIIPSKKNISKSEEKESTQALELATDGQSSETVNGTDLTPTESNVKSEEKSAEEVVLEATAQSEPVVKAAPKSWADLVRTKATAAAAPALDPQAAGLDHNAARTSLGSTLQNFSVPEDGSSNSKINFIEPRGLVNAGNMCYMNSILQVLLYTVPFSALLSEVDKTSTHKFNSQTLLLDAMVMFAREFRTIDSASSAEQLQRRLKSNELEQYGDPFTPDFVYDAIKRLPRFASMRRGQQQDAEEFLGFLLEQLHEECIKTMLDSVSDTPVPPNGLIDSDPTSPSTSDDKGWLEVGPKQKAAVTRSSGHLGESSPITKIFGGKLRSELRIPGAKNSVTFEPYQSLQLDIGASHVNNIVDALKGLTKPETLHGDFASRRGPGATATKQVFVETLPPVLILHLKRFQYDNTGGTQKIWKKIGYPLDLEIPKEVIPQQKRGSFLAHGGLPKYALVSVVYHHGKNASGGHYTVDIRRQDSREWVRFDDTVIRRIRREDVAEAGAEEDPKVLAQVLEQHKRDASVGSNVFDQIREENETQEREEQGWSHAVSKKGLSNGTMNGETKKGASTPNINGRFASKDKVAYILFYQRIS